ncbi:hypothetical protein IKF03_02920, partial [Candidatus Saccharibacteria bacterium]|nr:hypothetical protein [Candidatus Saccharibacteria bacterium]
PPPPPPPDISIEKYRELKDKLIVAEKTNYNKILIIPCSGNKGWYEMAENSALIYYYKICEALNLKVNFESDQDSYYHPYELGRIRLRSPELIKTRIKSANLLKDAKEKNHCYAFALNLNLTKKDLLNLKALELKRREENRSLVKINFSDPIFHFHLIESAHRLHESCSSKLDKLSSQQNGARLVNLIDSIILKYYQTPKIDRQLYAEFLEKINQIIYEVQLLSETRLWGAETSSSVISPILELKNLLKKRLK